MDPKTRQTGTNQSRSRTSSHCHSRFTPYWTLRCLNTHTPGPGEPGAPISPSLPGAPYRNTVMHCSDGIQANTQSCVKLRNCFIFDVPKHQEVQKLLSRQPYQPHPTRNTSNVLEITLNLIFMKKYFCFFSRDFWHKRKIYNFDPCNVLLSIATNIPVLLMTAFVLQSHKYI